MSQRGGDVQSNLRISDQPIASDLISLGQADVIIAMEPMEALRYKQYLSTDGWINLKTDSQHLYNYTQAVISHFDLKCEVANNDIYGSGYADEVLSVKTAYEAVYLQRGLPITYTRFSLGENKSFPMFDWEGDDVLEKDSEEARKH